ncbi:hypothetical protein M2277_005686 [Paenibacillus sp. LBL]|uniref:hypothetical protein n=1 Tax=Paenibacillus sp. LBL TaxID=2940563 RepID=UPI002473CAFB|nr:hypothetical protein [Paenibacillus sp. LBL]MDH6674987.1 hypothetical protein [Paenibacillus sp. LBL]
MNTEVQLDGDQKFLPKKMMNDQPMEELSSDQKIKMYKAKKRSSILLILNFIFVPFSFISIVYTLFNKSHFSVLWPILVTVLIVTIGLLFSFSFAGKKISKFKNMQDEMKARYSPGGPQYLWPFISYEHNHIFKYIPNVWNSLNNSKLLPLTPSIGVYSISAHLGLYEKELGKLMKLDGRYKHISLHLSDYAPPELRVHDFHEEGLSLAYYPHGIHGAKLKEIKEKHKTPVHIIIDFKGLLWYTKQNEEEKLFDAFKALHDAMEVDAILVIDAHKSPPVRTLLRRELMESIYLGPPETSTYEKIKDWLNSRQNKEWFDSHFVTHELGSGVSKIVVFKKRIVRV